MKILMKKKNICYPFPVYFKSYHASFCLELFFLFQIINKDDYFLRIAAQQINIIFYKLQSASPLNPYKSILY